VYENYRCSWNRSSLGSDLKFVYFRYIFRFLLHITRGGKRGARGHNSLGAKSLRGTKKSQCPKHFLHYNTLFPKDLRFKHGGAKFVSCPSRYLISLSPCTSGLSGQNGEICLQKYLPISGKLSIANYLNKMLLICQSHLTTDNNLKIEKNVYYFENKHNVPYSTKKALEVRVETNITKNSKAIIMLALFPGRCLLQHKGIENYIRQYFSTSQRET